MFKFLCKAAGMVAVTALILRLGEAVSNRVCGKQHSIKIIGRPKEAGSIGIIGGADGPTAIFISGRANPQAVSNVFSRLAGVVKARWNRLWGLSGFSYRNFLSGKPGFGVFTGTPARKY